MTVLKHSVVHKSLFQVGIAWIKYEYDTTCAWQQVDSLSWCYQYRSENISEATSGNACSSTWSLCSEVFSSAATLIGMHGTDRQRDQQVRTSWNSSCPFVSLHRISCCYVNANRSFGWQRISWKWMMISWKGTCGSHHRMINWFIYYLKTLFQIHRFSVYETGRLSWIVRVSKDVKRGLS